MVKSPSCEKQLSMKRGVWTEEEDAKILAFVSKHGSGNWTDVPKKAGLKRCGKSCRLRWTNYLRPDLKHDSFTPQEEELIVKLHAAIGSRWSIIAQQLPGRTDNDVKNYWNSKLKKKLSEMGIDPVTHKPFSKLLADYGNIGGLQKPSVRTGSLSKDFKNAILFKSERFSNPPQGFRNMNSQTNQTNMSLKAEEPNEDSFLCNIAHTNSNSLQLQALSLMTGASNCIPAPIFLENCMSSTSSPSSSSTCSTAAQENLAMPFSWNDFLLEDAFPPVSHSQEQENNAGFLSAAEYVTQQGEQKEKEDVKSQKQVPSRALQFSSSSSSGISFVEAMLDQEDEMFLNFPHLMEEPSNY